MSPISKTAKALLVLLAVMTSWAQSFGGRIVGLVSDASAGGAAHVTVAVLNEGTEAESRLSTAEWRMVNVDVGGETWVNASLAVQSTRQSIDITAEVLALRRDSGGVSEVVDTSQVQELPIHGRDFRKLAFLFPLAAPRAPDDSPGSFTVDHPNFALANVTFNSSGFGAVASTTDVAQGNPLGDGSPRLVQFALKLVF